MIRLSDGVEVAWGEYRALVDRAEYRRRQGRVTSDAAVILEGPALEVRGTGLEVDVEGRVARIGADVRARIRGRAR
ncbi:MAG: LPS export ABC transporter periplasmic protein LptC [Proteobacteria bacterium]|nr:LPS export ABC transporter periplasmic protein LptC [Pseudomonadota bacterium]